MSASPSHGLSASPGLDGRTLDTVAVAALQRVVDVSRARIPAPGLQVAIRLDNGQSWTGASGDRQLTPRRAVEPDTQFAVASITKTFVTAAIMQLVEEGTLTLDDPLSRWLADYPGARRITIRHLLGHTSGVFNYFEDSRYQGAVFANRSRRWTVAQILRLVRAPYCEPGACFHYSNTNFILLGRVLERETGRPLAEILRTRFIEPLSLTDTVFQPDEAVDQDAAHGHLWSGGSVFHDHSIGQRVVPHLSATTVAWAAGAMASDAEDLARWAQALYAGSVLEPESLALMTQFRRRDEYGLGTRTRIFEGRRAIGHLGGIRGFESAMWHFPAEGATIVVLSNRGMYSTDRTVRLIARVLFRHIAVPPPQYDPTRTSN